jgi:chaperonin GroES
MLKPLGDRILVEPSEPEETTKGGIILPDTAKKKPREGKVLAVGPGKLLDNGQRAPIEVVVGDVVVYSEYSGTEVKVADKEYMLISEDSVLAVKSGKA